MRLISRKMTTTHSREDVLRIMQNSNFRSHTWYANHNTFFLLYKVRWHKQPGLIPVRGIIKEEGEHTEVSLEIHGGLAFYIGLLFVAIGVLIAIYSLVRNTPNLYSSLCCFGVGAFVYVCAVFDGITCLDSLEHRLTQGQG